MKIIFLLAISALFVFSACNPKKQDDMLPREDTTQTADKVLVKTELTSGADVNTRIYRYDAQKRLIWYSNTSTNKDFTDDTTQVLRDNLGRIETIIYRSDSAKKFRDPTLDSIVYNVFYNGTEATPVYKLLKYSQFGFKFRDSFVYAYDAAQRIIKEEVYYFNRSQNAYLIYGTMDYGYDATGNMASSKTIYYDIDGNNTDYPFEISYTYDDKNNRLNLGNEAIVLQLQHGFSAHNLKSKVGTYPLDPQYNYALSYAYTYNSRQQPVSAVITNAGSGATSTQTYTYQ